MTLTSRAHLLKLPGRAGFTRNDLVRHPLLRSVTRLASRYNLFPPELLSGADLDVTFKAEFPGARFRYHVTPGDYLGARLFWQSWKQWEPYAIPQFAHFSRSAGRVLDVGAYTGIYTLFGCALNSQLEVFSFEPLPVSYCRMSDNVALNGFESRCKLFQAAVSNASGMARFHVEEDLTRSALSSEGEIEVPILTLNDVVPLDGRTALVKIDVEGHEHKVLQGMHRVLEDSHPVILFECVPNGPADELEAILRHYHYRIFSMTSHGPREISKLDPWQNEPGNHNYLASS